MLSVIDNQFAEGSAAETPITNVVVAPQTLLDTSDTPTARVGMPPLPPSLVKPPTGESTPEPRGPPTVIHSSTEEDSAPLINLESLDSGLSARQSSEEGGKNDTDVIEGESPWCLNVATSSSSKGSQGSYADQVPALSGSESLTTTTTTTRPVADGAIEAKGSDLGSPWTLPGSDKLSSTASDDGGEEAPKEVDAKPPTADETTIIQKVGAVKKHQSDESAPEPDLSEASEPAPSSSSVVPPTESFLSKSPSFAVKPSQSEGEDKPGEPSNKRAEVQESDSSVLSKDITGVEGRESASEYSQVKISDFASPKSQPSGDLDDILGRNGHTTKSEDLDDILGPSSRISRSQIGSVPNGNSEDLDDILGPNSRGGSVLPNSQVGSVSLQNNEDLSDILGPEDATSPVSEEATFFSAYSQRSGTENSAASQKDLDLSGTRKMKPAPIQIPEPSMAELKHQKIESPASQPPEPVNPFDRIVASLENHQTAQTRPPKALGEPPRRELIGPGGSDLSQESTFDSRASSFQTTPTQTPVSAVSRDGSSFWSPGGSTLSQVSTSLSRGNSMSQGEASVSRSDTLSPGGTSMSRGDTASHSGSSISRRDALSPDGTSFSRGDAGGSSISQRDTLSPDGTSFSRGDTLSPGGTSFSRGDTLSPGGTSFSRGDTGGSSISQGDTLSPGGTSISQSDTPNYMFGIGPLSTAGDTFSPREALSQGGDIYASRGDAVSPGGTSVSGGDTFMSARDTYALPGDTSNPSLRSDSISQTETEQTSTERTSTERTATERTFSTRYPRSRPSVISQSETEDSQGGRLWEKASQETEQSKNNRSLSPEASRFAESLMARTRSRAEPDAILSVSTSATERDSEKPNMIRIEKQDEHYIFNTTLARKRVHVVQLLAVGLLALLVAFLGSFWVQSSCHFVSASVEVGENDQVFELHYGLWKYTPIDSAFRGYSYCYQYDDEYTGDAPMYSRWASCMALLGGAYSICVLWYYLIMGRGTRKMWMTASASAAVSGALQLCTLLIFAGPVCRRDECTLGPAGVLSVVASMVYFILAFEMYYNSPMVACMDEIPTSPTIEQPVNMMANLEMTDFEDGAKAYVRRIVQGNSEDTLPTLNQVQRVNVNPIGEGMFERAIPRAPYQPPAIV
jgi:hypothetical protein